MNQIQNFQTQRNPSRTYQKFFDTNILSTPNISLAPPYKVNNIKQKEITRPRPAREYNRFLPIKKALSGMDPNGTLNEFFRRDIITPLHRESLYTTFYDIKSPLFKHNNLYKTKINENSKWALNTIARAPNYECLPKVQQYKIYYFPPKYNNKDPDKYRASSLKSDHIGIKVPKIKKIDKKFSFLKLKADYSVSSETKKENWWKPYPSTNSVKNLSSKNYDIINFRPICGVNLNLEFMNKTLNCRKKGYGEYLDLTKTFRVNINKDFAEKYNQNPNRFHKFTGIFSNMYDAAHKNGNIIKPFGQKNGFNSGSATK